jgi:hypothetical protein
VGVGKVTSLTGMRITRSMLEENHSSMLCSILIIGDLLMMGQHDRSEELFSVWKIKFLSLSCCGSPKSTSASPCSLLKKPVSPSILVVIVSRDFAGIVGAARIEPGKRPGYGRDDDRWITYEPIPERAVRPLPENLSRAANR